MTSAPSTPDRARELSRLDFLVGDWQAAGKVLPGPFGPGGDSTGTSSYRWELHGQWLAFQSVLELPGLGAYQVNGGTTYDARAGLYRAYAVNSLGILIAYEGDWDGDGRLVFTAVYPDSPTRPRVWYRQRPDESVDFISEQLVDGEYQPYFETVFTR